MTPGFFPHFAGFAPPGPPPDLSGYTAPPALQSRPPTNADPDIIAYYGDYAITERSTCTQRLVGATFVQASSVEFQGRRTVIFVFSDLAVKSEGTFVLRYRAYNIFARAHGGHNIPILAECFGGPFKVYSTKEFPGLRASTDLTKHLSYYGVRANMRENERKRRKKDKPESAAGPSNATSSPMSASRVAGMSPSTGRSGSGSAGSGIGKGKGRLEDGVDGVDGIDGSETSDFEDG